MKLSDYIDHTLLKPDCSKVQVQQLCREAIEYSFKAVCIPPYFVREAVAQLENFPIKVATVAGFPLGYSTTPAKVEEMKRAIDEGVHELDVVVNLCAVKDGAWSYVRNDIDSMTRAAHLKGKSIKIILETGLLTHSEIVKLCDLCREVDVDFVKTSTGMNGPGASVEIIKFLRQNLPSNIKIKASGGIKTASFAQDLIRAGADRIGTSSAVEMMK